MNNKGIFFFQVTRYIHHKIVGKMHDAKVVLALGNTLWIDPMVSVSLKEICLDSYRNDAKDSNGGLLEVL